MTTTTLPPYKQLCQELLLCKFSEEEIELVLWKYIPNLRLATDRTANVLAWGLEEDIEYVLEEMGLDDYDDEDYDEVMGRSSADIESWTKQDKREGL